MNSKGIYVASRASVPERAAMWRALRSEGWPIVSTWLDDPALTVTAAEARRSIEFERDLAVLLRDMPKPKSKTRKKRSKP